jgi:hypothetical protein
MQWTGTQLSEQDTRTFGCDMIDLRLLSPALGPCLHMCLCLCAPQDPSNGQFAICDETLRQLTGEKRFKLFGASKLFGKHFLKKS